MNARTVTAEFSGGYQDGEPTYFARGFPGAPNMEYPMRLSTIEKIFYNFQIEVKPGELSK